jgi:hypothetical protein
VKRILPAEYFVALFFVAMLALVSCAHKPYAGDTSDSLPAVGGGVERVDANIDAAERLNTAAKPLAGPAAKPLLNQQTEAHRAAKEAVVEVKGSLASATTERRAMNQQIIDQAKTISQITGGWGYRLQLFVTRVQRILIGIVVAHFLFGIAGLVVGGAPGALLAKIGVWIWPPAWFQSARDNYYFRRVQQQQ